MTSIFVIDERKSHNRFKRSSLKNGKHFLKIILLYRNLHRILRILKKKTSFLALTFQKVFTLRNVVTAMLESSSFITPFESQRFHASQTLLKPILQHFYSNFPLIYHILSWETSLLVRSKILGLFCNTLTADHMYSCHIWEKLPQQVQTLLSLKPRTFSENFIAFFQSTQNFSHLEQKDQLHSSCLWVPSTAKSCTAAPFS